MRDCEAVADNMSAYQKLYNILEGDFDGCELNYVTRANNTEADKLANIGSTRAPIPPDVFLESIKHRFIKTAKAPEPTSTAETDTTSTSVNGTTKSGQVAIADPVDKGEAGNIDAEQEPPPPKGPVWTRPFLNYLVHNVLPQDITEACRIT